MNDPLLSMEGASTIGRGRGFIGILLALALASCGAKTGLRIPDASREPDANMDAGSDASMDAGADSGVCQPELLDLERRGAQLVFVIDRSNSMRDDLEGRRFDEPGAGPSRWVVLRDTLALVLPELGPSTEVGAKFYPAWSDAPPTTAEDACATAPGMDLAPASRNVESLLRFFRSTEPRGGTPTALGLREVRSFFERQPAPGVSRFVILSTDGGPNCNPDTGVDPRRCLCTGPPSFCTDDSTFGPYNCIDADRTLSELRALYDGLGVPVYVIGIDDPTRPDLGDVMDRMAVAGGRPREASGERRFYSVRRPDDLRGALTTITESIDQCVFSVDPAPAPGAAVDLRLDGTSLPRDTSRSEGWDFTRADRRELRVFGEACERVATGGDLLAEVSCPEGD